MHRYRIFLKSGEIVEVEADSVKCIYNEGGRIYRFDFVKNKYKNMLNLMAMIYSDTIFGWVELPKENETGHWIMHQDHRECSKCGAYLLKDMPRNSYCPNCGTRMTESEDKS